MNKPAPQPNERFDKVGTFASTICAVHCAICAFLPVAFSSLGVGFLIGHEAEWGFTLFAVAAAVGALFIGWRQHRSPMVAGLLVLGIVGLLASRGLEMGSGHHDHHDEHNTTETAKTDKHAETADHHSDKKNIVQTNEGEEHHEGEKHHEGEEHHEGEDEHAGLGHLIGAIVGILGGFILVIGHILNIRTARKSREDCCA